MTIIYDVKPRMADSVYVAAPFDKGKEELEAAEYEVISAERNAQLRIQEGKEAFISKNGNWVKEGLIYVPGEDHVYLTKQSPIMIHPKEATDAHRNGNEFYQIKEETEKAITDSVKVPYNQEPIPTNGFGEEEITRYVFGETAKSYGEFLRESGISEMPVFLVGKNQVDNNDKSFSRQLWLYDLDGRSVLVGNYGDLYCDSRVRGVPRAV